MKDRRARSSKGPSFVGRVRELQRLDALLDDASAVYVAGVAGIGKSAALTSLLERRRAGGEPAVRIDCRSIEPTEAGFVDGLASALGWPGADDLDEAIDRLAGAPVIIALDQYEVFRLMDTWIRQRLIPRLPEGVSLILASREPPVAAWFSADLAALVRHLSLGPLDESDSLHLLRDRGVDEKAARRLNEIARGHPLALTLAAETTLGGRDPALEEVAAARVLTELTHLFLEDVQDRLSRHALEAASVLRRATVPLLEAMLDESSGETAFERLSELPFVETARDGLVVHEAVGEAIAARLQAVDPARHRRYRRGAWHALRTDVREAAPSELWRYTADMLYLISNPVVREAFFPSGSQPLSVEPARPEDEDAISLIARRHEPPEAARILEAWWRAAPESFSVIRDRDESVRAFSCVLDHDLLRSRLVKEDPVVAAWRAHLRDEPVPPGQLSLGLRRWLDIDHGEMPCAAQAACWLDVKRTYMALRPALRRMYVVVRDAATYWPVVQELTFQQLAPSSAGPPTLGGVAFANVVLDFGSGSVDGWLARLAAAELGIDHEAGVDQGSRELRIDGRTVPLTPLEFGLLQHLDACGGRTVTRAELLREVWGTDYTGGSNVVDVVVRSLRGKLGSQADVVETVRGAGYRLRPDWRSRLA